MAIEFNAIGTIHTPYTDWAPHQPLVDGEGDFYLEIAPEWQEGLADLDSFSHAYVFFHLNKSTTPATTRVKPPWAKGKEIGVFASRSPRRPNPIALSIVQVLAVEGGKVRISPIDALDGSPVLDVKPYIPAIDSREDANNGWIAKLDDGDHLLQHLRGAPHDHGDGHGHGEHHHHGHGHRHHHDHEHHHGEQVHAHPHDHEHEHGHAGEAHDHTADPEHQQAPHEHEHED